MVSIPGVPARIHWARPLARFLGIFCVGMLILIGVIALSIVLLYTRPAFSLLQLHAFALDVVNSFRPPSELIPAEFTGRSLTPAEELHFLDVRLLVNIVRFALPVATLAMAIIARRAPAVFCLGANVALGLLLTLLLSIGVIYLTLGYVQTSTLLHGLFFAEGSYVFAKETLTAALYDKEDMIAAFLFVVGATLLTMSALWLSAQILSRRLTARNLGP